MSAILTIWDEAATGKLLRSFVLELSRDTTTIRELIRARVEQEVTRFNARQDDAPFHGLVQPRDAERLLNGFRVPRHRVIDWQEQFERALEAFERNGFLVLVDDRQAESLDDPIVISEVSKVSFVKLVPLVGG
jgi:hypothetical protein